MSVPSAQARHQAYISIALAGLAGEIAFELYAWLISPMLFGVILQPSNLVIALIAKFTSLQIPHSLAFPIHFIIGSFGFGLFVYLIRLFVSSKVWISGFVSGIFLWFIAQGLLAPLIGRSFMMDFGAYTQSSFIGHVGMTLLMAQLFHIFSTHFAKSPVCASS